MKAYSLDLRPRVVDAYEQGEGSLSELGALLRAAVAKHPDATLKELQAVLAAQGRVTVSEATLCRALQKLHLPRKKKRFAASERNEKKRRAFRRKVKVWDVKKLVFDDAMGSNIS